jgi:hypothetical protein
LTSLHHRSAVKEAATMAKQVRKTKLPVPKTVLRLPDLDQAKSAVLNSLSSVDAQRGYRHAIDEIVEWYCSEPRLSFSKTVVLRYRIHLESRHLAPGTINLRLGAVRRLAYEASDCGLLYPDLAAGIRRVKGVKKIGVRLGNWSTPEQSERLWNAPDCQVLKGKHDRALGRNPAPNIFKRRGRWKWSGGWDMTIPPWHKYQMYAKSRKRVKRCYRPGSRVLFGVANRGQLHVVYPEHPRA